MFKVYYLIFLIYQCYLFYLQVAKILFYAIICSARKKEYNMTEELLVKIKKEYEDQIKGLEKYNEYARLRNRLAKDEEIKASLGLPYTRDMYLPEKLKNK